MENGNVDSQKGDSAKEKDIEEIIIQFGLPAEDVSVILLRLEVKRLIRQLPGKTFVRARLMT